MTFPRRGIRPEMRRISEDTDGDEPMCPMTAGSKKQTTIEYWKCLRERVVSVLSRITFRMRKRTRKERDVPGTDHLLTNGGQTSARRHAPRRKISDACHAHEWVQRGTICVYAQTTHKCLSEAVGKKKKTNTNTARPNEIIKRIPSDTKGLLHRRTQCPRVPRDPSFCALPPTMQCRRAQRASGWLPAVPAQSRRRSGCQR